MSRRPASPCNWNYTSLETFDGLIVVSIKNTTDTTNKFFILQYKPVSSIENHYDDSR